MASPMNLGSVKVMLNKVDKKKLKDTFSSNIRVQAYFGIICVLSLLSLPEDYKIDKRNILNQWFVKLGWFWTTALLLPLSFSSIKSSDRDGVAQAIFRVITSTLIWFVSVGTFQFFDTATGIDISGHTFLMIFSNLLISSELSISNSGDNDHYVSEHKPKFILSLRILTALWDFMLIQTALYYHTILQKLIAAIWAFGSWYVMHILFYDKMQNKKSSDHVSESRL